VHHEPSHAATLSADAAALAAATRAAANPTPLGASACAAAATVSTAFPAAVASFTLTLTATAPPPTVSKSAVAAPVNTAPAFEQSTPAVHAGADATADAAELSKADAAELSKAPATARNHKHAHLHAHKAASTLVASSPSFASVYFLLCGIVSVAVGLTVWLRARQLSASGRGLSRVASSDEPHVGKMPRKKKKKPPTAAEEERVELADAEEASDVGSAHWSRPSRP